MLRRQNSIELDRITDDENVGKKNNTIHVNLHCFGFMSLTFFVFISNAKAHPIMIP